MNRRTVFVCLRILLACAACLATQGFAREASAQSQWCIYTPMGLANANTNCNCVGSGPNPPASAYCQVVGGNNAKVAGCAISGGPWNVTITMPSGGWGTGQGSVALYTKDPKNGGVLILSKPVTFQ